MKQTKAMPSLVSDSDSAEIGTPNKRIIVPNDIKVDVNAKVKLINSRRIDNDAYDRYERKQLALIANEIYRKNGGKLAKVWWDDSHVKIDCSKVTIYNDGDCVITDCY